MLQCGIELDSKVMTSIGISYATPPVFLWRLHFWGGRTNWKPTHISLDICWNKCFETKLFLSLGFLMSSINKLVGIGRNLPEKLARKFWIPDIHYDIRSEELCPTLRLFFQEILRKKPTFPGNNAWGKSCSMTWLFLKEGTFHCLDMHSK